MYKVIFGKQVKTDSIFVYHRQIQSIYIKKTTENVQLYNNVYKMVLGSFMFTSLISSWCLRKMSQISPHSVVGRVS